MKKIALFISIFLCVNINIDGLFAQNWSYYFTPGSIYSMASDHESVYLGVEGRIVKLNRKTFQPEYLIPFNEKEKHGEILTYNSIHCKDSLNTLIAIPSNFSWEMPDLQFPVIKVNGNSSTEIYRFNSGYDEYTNSQCRLDNNLNTWMICNYYDDWSHHSYLVKVSKSDTVIFKRIYGSYVGSLGIPVNYFEQFNSLDCSPDGCMWVGTDKGLVEFKNDSMILHPSPVLPAYSCVSRLKTDKSGRKWCGVQNAVQCAYLNDIGYGLMLYDDANWTLFNTSNSGLPGNLIKAIDEDSQNNVWLATNKGLVKYDGSTWKVFNTANSAIPGDSLTNLIVDEDDIKWIVVGGNHLYRFDDVDYKEIRIGSPGMTTNRIYTLFINNKEVYAGGESSDIVHIKSMELEHWRHFEFQQISDFCCFQSILVDRNNEYYGVFGSDRENAGLFIVNSDSIRFLNGINTPELAYLNYAQSNVGAITLDKNNKLYMSVPGGLGTLENGNLITYTKQNSGLLHSSINEIAVDSKNNLWMASYYGLSTFDGQNFKPYNILNSGPSEGLCSIKIDKLDRVWLGTYQKGLIMFDGENWKVWDTLNSSIPSNRINSIAIVNPAVWLGTDKGLVKFENDQFTTFNCNNSGLPISNNISAVAADGLKNIWIGSDAGISVFNEIGFVNPDNISGPLEFAISPNPGIDRINLEFDYYSDFYIQIINLSGQIVFEGYYGNTSVVELQLEKLGRGFYIVKAFDQVYGRSGSEKLIICQKP